MTGYAAIMMDMCALPLRLRQQGITLIFLKEQLTFSAGEETPMQELQLHMVSAFSQFEQALIRERQAEGISAKKQHGERTSRPPADIRKILLNCTEEESDMINTLMSDGKVLDRYTQTNVLRASILALMLIPEEERLPLLDQVTISAPKAGRRK
ncbi:recombinase family protein [Photorhabdus africana]|uniref:recombinase family protein n=1 Tax=Photorhabdus africana TaxID=3097554 RepID=UPI002B40CEBA|nr:recombinase family protein [Photorhabdus sp. CRI-LC]